MRSPAGRAEPDRAGRRTRCRARLRLPRQQPDGTTGSGRRAARPSRVRVRPAPEACAHAPAAHRERRETPSAGPPVAPGRGAARAPDRTAPAVPGSRPGPCRLRGVRAGRPGTAPAPVRPAVAAAAGAASRARCRERRPRPGPYGEGRGTPRPVRAPARRCTPPDLPVRGAQGGPPDARCSFRRGCRILEVWSLSGTSRSSGRGGRRG